MAFFILTLIIILLFLFIVFFILGKIIFNSLITRKLHNEKEKYTYLLNNGLIDEELLSSVHKENISITSVDNLNLVGLLIKNKIKSKKFIILVHGVSIGYVGSLKYFDIFYKNGFNVLIINQRRHGESDGMYSTYGYFEKYDLNMWIKYLKTRFGENIILGLHGESMGAGTVMECLRFDNNIKFAIEDCGYSDLSELVKFQITHNYKKIWYLPLMCGEKLANLITKTKAKFYFSYVSPIKVISEVSTPILFIHGKLDYFVPWYMCENLYNAKKHGYKELYLVDGADHAEALAVNKELYAKKVTDFINHVLNETKR
ncbi:alpha/beta hydrolase [Clostridium tarantellae]|uniref:Prolyl oligopeptidase family serine peptidase n=1 Tax=Clostridium tarantellae TaxID=39493 RepID=A0A6I1MNW8_9CLOT|nr:alpha/beta hydrolase [Clostridium tarantellae]MPQ44168.1 prolyl oligopeptidase family serine peptidase [Clostridium tarantellae]